MKHSDRTPILPQVDTGYSAERDTTTPARRLVAALLLWTARDISGFAARQRKNPGAMPEKHEREAIAWVTDDRNTAPFSFRWCCDVLGTEECHIRKTFMAVNHPCEGERMSSKALNPRH